MPQRRRRVHGKKIVRKKRHGSMADIGSPAVGVSVLPNLGIEGGSSIAVFAGVPYLIEIHYTKDTLIDLYINGSLLDHQTSTPTSYSFGQVGFGFWGYDESLSDNIHFQAWDLSIGTLRNGSDIFQNSLNSVPTVPPFINIQGSNGMAIIDSKLDFFNAETDSPIVSAGDGFNHDDVWIGCHFSFAENFIDFINTLQIGNGIQFIGLSSATLQGLAYNLSIFKD